VNRRTGEIGIRMALGAECSQIARMMMGESLPLGFGLEFGVPAAVLSSRLIASGLFGLKSGDPVTISFACAGMAIMTMLASYLPAYRAASVHPMQVLRSEYGPCALRAAFIAFLNCRRQITSRKVERPAPQVRN
jgi:putative ABC transport system permease protein